MANPSPYLPSVTQVLCLLFLSPFLSVSAFVLPTTLKGRGRDIAPRRGAAENIYDPILDWKPPPINEIAQLRQRVLEPMKALTSAVFFSTDEQGARHEGLSHLSTNYDSSKPILFVSNHQLAGFDSWIVVNEILDQCGIFVRSMTHPFLSKNLLDPSSFLETFGCLPVSPRNFYKLMQSNQPILLFPGGARESFHKTNEAYSMIAWPTDDKADFVRIAAKFGATVVPFSSVGAAESAFFLDELPFADTIINQALIQLVGADNAPYNARYDGGERISFPLILPKLFPARHYFLFGTPLDMSTVDYKDRDACKLKYKEIKQKIQNGCRDLMRAREQDPYDDPLRRVPFETLWRKQAPSFPVELLNSGR